MANGLDTDIERKEYLKDKPRVTKEGKTIVYYQPAKKPKVEGVQTVNPETGKVGGSRFLSDLQKKSPEIEYRAIPRTTPELVGARRLKEKQETKELAQKEAEFEAKRIAEGKVKPENVILTQKGSKAILQRILKEKAEKEAEERRKFPAQEERIERIKLRQRLLAAGIETREQTLKTLLEKLGKEQITKREKPREIEITLDPETARKLREQLTGKEIQQTILKAEFPDLRSFIKEEKRFAVIEAEQPFPPGLITTETGLISFFQTRKRKEAKTKLEEFGVILETPAKIGVSLEKEGRKLAGVSLIFVGRTAETAFGISPIGIAKSIKERGFAETVEQFTGIPLISAIKEDRLLKAQTPLGRAAEVAGIGTGVYLGSQVTKASIKGTKKGIQVLQKESARLRAPEFQPEVRAEKVKGFEPVGKGQQKFVKLTETGKEIPQFQQDIGQVVRVIISKKTGKIIRVIEPITGRVIRTGIPKDIQRTLDIQTKELIITDKALIARELGPIPGRKPIPTFKPPPRGKQVKLTKDFGEGLGEPSKFEVPSKPPKLMEKLFVDPTGAIAITETAIDFGRLLKEKVLTTPGMITIPTKPSLFLLPPIVEEEPKERFKPRIDIDIGRELKKEREKEFIAPPILEGLQVPDLDEALKQIGIQKPKIGRIPDVTKEPRREQERERERELIIIPDVDIREDTTLEQDFKLDVPKPPPPKPLPTKGVLLPPSPREKLRVPEEEEVFFVKAKSKGKFIALNKKALPRNKALNLGAEAVDNTASATFKLISAGKKKKEIVDDIGFNLRGKFIKKNSIYVEKNKHRIDSLGEIQGITVKGWLAQRRKGLRI